MTKNSLICFASKQTVRPGERCALIPIVLRETADGLEVEGDSHTWTPLSGPIVGQYDGQRAVQIEHSENNRTWLGTLFEILLMRQPRSGEFADNRGRAAVSEFDKIIKSYGITRPSLLKSPYEDAVALSTESFFAQADVWFNAVFRASFEKSPIICFSVLHGDAMDWLLEEMSPAFVEQEVRAVLKTTFESIDGLTSGSSSVEMPQKGLIMHVLMGVLESICIRRGLGIDIALGCVNGLDEFFEKEAAETLYPGCSAFFEFIFLFDQLTRMGVTCSPSSYANLRDEEDPDLIFSDFVANVAERVKTHRFEKYTGQGDMLDSLRFSHKHELVNDQFCEQYRPKV